jgi:nitrogen fixation protein NifU and related proteins
MDRTEVLEIILDHYHNPRNYGEMEQADISMQGGNPGCGDIVTIYLKFSQAGQLLEVTYTGEGCTISQAATSMLTEMMPGHSVEQIEELNFHLIEELVGEELVKTRPKCATLGLDTIKHATRQYRQLKALEGE